MKTKHTYLVSSLIKTIVVACFTILVTTTIASAFFGIKIGASLGDDGYYVRHPRAFSLVPVDLKDMRTEVNEGYQKAKDFNVFSAVEDGIIAKKTGKKIESIRSELQKDADKFNDLFDQYIDTIHEFMNSKRSRSYEEREKLNNKLEKIADKMAKRYDKFNVHYKVFLELSRI